MRSRLFLFLIFPALLLADGPKDNLVENVRQIPPPGIEVPAETAQELQLQLDALNHALAKIANDPLLPDVEIFRNAVHFALNYNEFQKPKELEWASQQLDIGLKRADALAHGEAPWTKQTGLVVRGFRSKIDGTAQPYGLVIPESYNFEGIEKYRTDFWFHGRAEKVNEVNFIQDRMTNVGRYEPNGNIMLHPWARYSNANKFAGEIDCLEALEHVKENYRVDEDRVLVRGFSMGGAACWQFAVHYPGRWAAANPGAGFSETPEFLRTFQGETLNPSWFEKKLWRLYDCTDWALNLKQLPTVAYSGELDRQKQAADIMEVALAKEGIELTHIIGPKMEHNIDEASKIEITNRLDEITKKGRQFPDELDFTTYTLRYNKSHWLQIDQLGEHWEKAVFSAKIEASNQVTIGTIENIEAFTLDLKPPLTVNFPDQTITVAVDTAAEFHRSETGWSLGKAEAALAKKHGLQGPIDDAFMGSFLFVKPSNLDAEKATDQWVKAEMDRAINHWRQHFRGVARVKLDSEVTEEDIAQHHLVLWGDAASNSLIAELEKDLPALPMDGLDSASHVPIMIYPNPKNSERYVVLNSGFTYREYDYLNNARQTPKLPDWAIIDLSEKPGPQRPGKIAKAGFFDESWQVK